MDTIFKYIITWIVVGISFVWLARLLHPMPAQWKGLQTAATITAILFLAIAAFMAITGNFNFLPPSER